MEAGVVTKVKRQKEKVKSKKITAFLLMLFYLIFSFFLFIGCSESNFWIDSLPKPWTLSEQQVSEILPQFHNHYPDFHDRLKAFALWQVGKPYDIFKLGEEIEPDPDPIIRLDVSDCTVHVLTSLAFSQSKSWAEAKENMVEIHYKDGKPSYKSRWHFTADRMHENPSTVNITKNLVDMNQLDTVDITLNLKEDGNEFLDLGWEKKTTVSFIPNELITKTLLKKLPEVCGIAFIKKAWIKMGLIIAHEGMIIDKKNLVHASSEYGETMNIDFMEYYFRESGPLFDGIMVYEFHPINNSLIKK